MTNETGSLVACIAPRGVRVYSKTRHEVEWAAWVLFRQTGLTFTWGREISKGPRGGEVERWFVEGPASSAQIAAVLRIRRNRDEEAKARLAAIEAS